jgi:lipopolysaccharide transport system ATP-binding protein
MMSESAIKINNVSKFYKLYNNPKNRLKEALHPFRKKYHEEFYALKEINLEIKKGEIFGIIGKNGSGKSTLLKLISGVLKPSTGGIEVNGSISALLELGVGFNPDFTGIENVFFYGTIMGFSKEEIEASIDKVFEFADIGDFIHQPLKTYSSGMKARLAFAVATQVNPDILIVDEILAVGDAVFQRKCFAKMENLLKDGKTVVLVSHNKSSILSICDRAMLLDCGNIIFIGDTNDTVKNYEILCNKNFLIANKEKVIHKKLSNISNRNYESKEAKDDEVIFDYSLITKPTIFKKSNIEFVDFTVLNIENNKTNILKTGEKYFIQAIFHFYEDIKDITFALRMKNQQGFVVAWMGFPFNEKEYLTVFKGEKSFRFSFDCNLLSGVYLIDFALQSFINDDLFYHIGRSDAYMFVIHKEGKKSFGTTFLNFQYAKLS